MCLIMVAGWAVLRGVCIGCWACWIGWRPWEEHALRRDCEGVRDVLVYRRSGTYRIATLQPHVHAHRHMAVCPWRREGLEGRECWCARQHIHWHWDVADVASIWQPVNASQSLSRSKCGGPRSEVPVANARHISRKTSFDCGVCHESLVRRSIQVGRYVTTKTRYA
jgi:hypothetical protein